jgi:hypothetical protein
MGMEFPGQGSVYLSQLSEFKRPLYVDLVYQAKFTVISIDPIKHTAEIQTQVFDKERGKLMVDGVAKAMNADKF